MGTRNVTCVVKDGEYRVYQYGQWDGYPSGQGDTIATFIRNCIIPDGGIRFRSQVDRIVRISDEELRQRWAEVGATSDWVNMEQAQKFKEKFGEHFSRDCGAEILQYIFDSEQPPEVYFSGEGFPEDSLFCEWVYVVNLDTGHLEIFRGFNKRRLGKKQRFYPLQKEGKQKYYPCRLWKEYAFEDITPDLMAKLQEEYQKS
jgi:hypothetical protein